MKIYFHNDQDGYLSKYWVTKAYEKNLIKDDGYFLKMFPSNYGNEINLSDIKSNENIIIVDWSIPPETMAKLLEITPNVIWIDHHPSAIAQYKNFQTEFRKSLPLGYREEGISASALTAMWFFWEDFVGTKRVEQSILAACVKRLPPFAQFINDFDLDIMELPDTMAFKYGSEAFDYTSPDFWEKCATDAEFVINCITTGKSAELYLKFKYNEDLDNGSYEAVVDNKKFKDLYGKRILMLNSTFIGCPVFLDNRMKYDFCIKYVDRGNIISGTLYSKTANCIPSAQLLGGGGHTAAAGFRCDREMFFDLFKFTRKAVK